MKGAFKMEKSIKNQLREFSKEQAPDLWSKISFAIENDDKDLHKIELVQTKDNKVLLYRYITAACACLVLVFSVYISYKFKIKDDISADTQQENTSTDIILPQIEKYFEPFKADEYSSTKMIAPHGPRNYETLIDQSSVVIICDVNNIGTYKNKYKVYNPKVSLGTYIYTIKIERIIKGSIDEKIEDYIAVTEKAWASPKYTIGRVVIGGWNFTPYTTRAKETWDVKIGNKYLIFLNEKNDTECFMASFNGFGIFPIEYIEKEAEKNTLSEIQKEYDNRRNVTRTPYNNDILYRYCAVRVKNDFLLN